MTTPVELISVGGVRSGSTAADSTGANGGTYTGVTFAQPAALVGDPDTAASFDGVNDPTSSATPTVGAIAGIAAGDVASCTETHDANTGLLLGQFPNEVVQTLGNVNAACCYFAPGCSETAQEQWLRGDLASRPAACTLAVLHDPLFTSGSQCHTGGADLYPFTGTAPNSEARNAATSGVLRITLHPAGYDWTFMPVAGQTFSDSGTHSCHGIPPR